MGRDEITRRRFVRDTTLAAAGVTAAVNAARAAEDQPVEKTRSYHANMEYRRLGKTGLMLSAVSLGGHWKKIPYRFGSKEFADNRRYVMCNNALTASIPGLITTDQVHNATKAIRERRELDLTETRQLQEAVDEMWANLPKGCQWLKNEWEYV